MDLDDVDRALTEGPQTALDEAQEEYGLSNGPTNDEIGKLAAEELALDYKRSESDY
ncbi:hypothetical protein [Candidatus Nanohalococcus occultus]|uniref:hypothetical protein n=1 Tax=Candidatus Nanohalococcus occultus TaxID=2978047 RepID=UPI0039DFEBA2